MVLYKRHRITTDQNDEVGLALHSFEHLFQPGGNILGTVHPRVIYAAGGTERLLGATINRVTVS